MTQHPSVGGATPFLATTALEEFWETTGTLVFLGEWCLRFTRESFWKPLNGQLLRSPWSDRRRLEAAQREVSAAYERYLPRLVAAMNQVHAVQRSDRYWRIVLGPWLSLYLPVVFDRFENIRCARDAYPVFQTIVLEETSFVTPRDTLDFAYRAKEDGYNLQLYSSILNALGLKFPSRALAAEEVMPQGISPVPSYRARFWQVLRTLLTRTLELGQQRARVVTKSTYFPLLEELKLTWMSGGAIWPNKTPPISMPVTPKDLASRDIVKSHLPSENDFDRVCSAMLPQDLPQCFVEGFDELVVEASKRYRTWPSAILSANAWHYDEAFKCWAAEASARGTKLLGAQHGGNYGSLDAMPFEDHETAITDSYFSWGWKREGRPATVIPMPATKMTGRRGCDGRKTTDTILYVATSAPRYLQQFPFSPSDFSEYLRWQSRFIASLSVGLRRKLRVRLHYEDLGWDMKARWLRDLPEVKFESWDLTFRDSLERCRLYISDHLSTTFIEALVQDKPTILYWDPASNQLRAEALSLYDQLREVGILHDSPESAAMAVGARYGEIDQWWHGGRCQRARREFCERFGRTSAHALQDWARMLTHISSDSSPAPSAC